MTEIALRDEPNEIEPSGLQKWAADARQVAIIAESIAKTSFVPKAFSGKPNEVTAAILTGAEIGLGPMAALQEINPIQGTPSLSALAMRGIVQGRGHDIWVEESTDTRAIVCGQRAGSAHIQRSEWTIQRAQKMGLTNRDNWRNQPKAMLIARATSECCRLVAADALVGLAYSAEELGDEAPIKVRTAQRKPAPEPVPAPELEAPELAAIEPAPAVDADVIEGEPEDWPVAAVPGGAA